MNYGEGYSMPDTGAGGGAYGGGESVVHGHFQQQQGGPQMGAPMQQHQQQQHQQHQGAQNMQYRQPPPQQQQQQQQHQQHQPPPQQHQPPMWGGGGGGDPMMEFGNSAVTQMGLQYGASVAAQGKSYVDKSIGRFVSPEKLKYYFAVNTSYVRNKLKIVLFPFTHRNWQRREAHRDQQPGGAAGAGPAFLTPRDDINAPDLYIPLMALVTFVLVIGLSLGMQERFAPELLGITASSVLVWGLLEVLVLALGFHLLNVNDVSFLDTMAYCGYKYVAMSVTTIAYVFVGDYMYTGTLLYTSIADGYFLIRTLRLAILPESSTSVLTTHNKRRNYFLLFVAGMQVWFCYYLTRH